MPSSGWSVSLDENLIRHTHKRQISELFWLSTFNRDAFLRADLVTSSATSSFYDKTITKLDTPSERCNEQRRWNPLSNVTPTLLFFLHTPCVPDQIRLSDSGEKMLTGICQQRRTDTIWTNRHFV
jgi:hypothetical protein